MNQPNRIAKMSREEYLSIDAINISSLLSGYSKGQNTMAHLRYALDNKPESTDALRVGIAVHMAVLEPEEFSKRHIYFPHPSCDAKVRRGKEWEKFAFENRDKTILTEDQAKSVVEMRDALFKFPPFKKLNASKGRNEVAAIWTDEETGLLCKGMIDRMCEWNGYTALPDIKTCVCASKEDFAKTIGNFGYHARAAWYLDGLDVISPKDRRFFWFLVEKEAPHLCNWFDAHDDGDALVTQGRKVYRKILNQYAECLKSGEWPGYPISDSPEQISLNKWDME